MENSGKSRKQKAKEVFISYIKSMLFAFTGGNVTLPLLQQQLADKYGLMTRDEVLENHALGMALPGVISLNIGILNGRQIAGWLGVFAAVAGILAPAFFGMLLITLSYSLLSALPFIASFIGGIRVASVAIILTNAIAIIGKNKTLFALILVALSFVTTCFLKWNIVIVILLCGMAGVLRVRFTSGAEEESGV